MSDRLALAGLNSACALSVVCLPEREAHRPIFDALTVVLDAMSDNDIWPALYVKWELGLLRDLGFGLDFSHCAATGVTEDLTYLSPKSGKAVSEAAATPYKEKLFPIPGFLRADNGGSGAPFADVLAGLKMTEYFVDRRILRIHGLELPEARYRLVKSLERAWKRSETQSK